MKLLIGRQGEEDEEREKETVKEEEKKKKKSKRRRRKRRRRRREKEEEVIGELVKIKEMIREEFHGLKKAIYIRPVFYSNSPDDTKLD